MWILWIILSGFFAFVTPVSARADAVEMHAQTDAPSPQYDDPFLPLKVRLNFFRPSRIPFPADSPYRHEVATLGKMLFFDPRLSGSQSISCSTCHNPSFGWATPVHPTRNIGLQARRHAPSIVNAAWVTPLFWDGRATTLEEQAADLIMDHSQMESDFDTMVQRLHKVHQYRDWFEQAFPGEGITKRTIVASLATYQRTIVSGIAPFDLWIEGDSDAISDTAKRGFELFRGRAGCVSCHSGWMFTANAMHDVGLSGLDLGQGALLGQPLEANFRFKTPGLRDITMRAPYMHDGSLPDLRSVIRHYANGGSIWINRTPEIEAFTISEDEIDELIAFLETLTAIDAVTQAPILPSN